MSSQFDSMSAITMSVANRMFDLNFTDLPDIEPMDKSLPKAQLYYIDYVFDETQEEREKKRIKRES